MLHLANYKTDHFEVDGSGHYIRIYNIQCVYKKPEYKLTICDIIFFALHYIVFNFSQKILHISCREKKIPILW